MVVMLGIRMICQKETRHKNVSPKTTMPRRYRLRKVSLRHLHHPPMQNNNFMPSSCTANQTMGGISLDGGVCDGMAMARLGRRNKMRIEGRWRQVRWIVSEALLVIYPRITGKLMEVDTANIISYIIMSHLTHIAKARQAKGSDQD